METAAKHLPSRGLQSICNCTRMLQGPPDFWNHPNQNWEWGHWTCQLLALSKEHKTPWACFLVSKRGRIFHTFMLGQETCRKHLTWWLAYTRESCLDPSGCNVMTEFIQNRAWQGRENENSFLENVKIKISLQR